MTKVIPGTNDLATLNPNLAAQWHPTKNGDLLPSHVSFCSGKKTWWKCSEGHEWQAQINSRQHGSGCPICKGKIKLTHQGLLLGLKKNTTFSTLKKNNLAIKNPKLAAEWHPTKNGELTPEQVTPGLAQKVWWKCSEGHEWEASIANRKNGTHCPYCSGKKILSGYNDLATVNPTLAAQWHPNKNGDLLPSQVSRSSNKTVWWLCPVCGYEWQASIANRNKGRGCQNCYKKRKYKK